MSNITKNAESIIHKAENKLRKRIINAAETIEITYKYAKSSIQVPKNRKEK